MLYKRSWMVGPVFLCVVNGWKCARACQSADRSSTYPKRIRILSVERASSVSYRLGRRVQLGAVNDDDGRAAAHSPLSERDLGWVDLPKSKSMGCVNGTCKERRLQAVRACSRMIPSAPRRRNRGGTRIHRRRARGEHSKCESERFERSLGASERASKPSRLALVPRWSERSWGVRAS